MQIVPLPLMVLFAKVKITRMKLYLQAQNSIFCLESKTFIFCKIFYSVTVQCLFTRTLLRILNQAVNLDCKRHMSQLIFVIEALNTQEGI